MFDFFLAPRSARLLMTAALLLSLSSCSLQPRQSDEERLAAWLPADVLLLGEQHDAGAHQRVQQVIVATLAARGQLAGLAGAMADSGTSTARSPPAPAPPVGRARQVSPQ